MRIGRQVSALANGHNCLCSPTAARSIPGDHRQRHADGICRTHLGHPPLVRTSIFVIYNTSPLTTAGTPRAPISLHPVDLGLFLFAADGLAQDLAAERNFAELYPAIPQPAGQCGGSAQQVAQGQDVVVNTLQQKFKSDSGVNIDAEMANLIALQNIYGANAHVLAVVQTMMQTLLQAQR